MNNTNTVFGLSISGLSLLSSFVIFSILPVYNLQMRIMNVMIVGLFVISAMVFTLAIMAAGLNSRLVKMLWGNETWRNAHIILIAVPVAWLFSIGVGKVIDIGPMSVVVSLLCALTCLVTVACAEFFVGLEILKYK